MRCMILMVLVSSLGWAGTSHAAVPGSKEAIQKVTVSFEPATAKPGQTVTLKITIEMAPGWHTYPSEQPHKAAKSFTNQFTFVKNKLLRPKGKLQQPKNAKEQSFPEIGVPKLLEYYGKASWEQQFTLSTSASSGKLKQSVKLQISACDDNGCLPPKMVNLDAILTVK